MLGARKYGLLKNPGFKIIAHAHSSGENKQFIFNLHCFKGKACFEIAYDDTFRGTFVDQQT